MQIPELSRYINVLCTFPKGLLQRAKMVFSLKVILFLSLLLLPVLKSSQVTLNNNGYDGIVIAINPSIPEDEKLIQNIKVREKFISHIFLFQ